MQSNEQMSKYQKTLHNDFIMLLILEIIMIIYSLTSQEGVINIFNIIYSVLSIIGFVLTLNNSKFSWIIGIVIGIAMMLSIMTFDIIDALLGLFVIIHSIMCLIEIKKTNKKAT